MGLEEKSYQLHSKSFSEIEIEKDLLTYKNWFEKSTTDLWRHKRMLKVLNPFLDREKGAPWLTVGDGRFGTSATYINQHGGRAIATDIDITLLEVAKQNNMLADYRYANAEKLPFTDEQFDYAYCKQAYHHFPRPILAVYEMLRVSKNAVIFTEPHDFIPSPILRTLLKRTKYFLKNILGKKNIHHDTGNYESIGNYVYSISVREFEKIALGMGLPGIAFKRFDEIYLKGVENEAFHPQAEIFKKIKFILSINKIKHFFGLSYPNTIQMIIFKSQPDVRLIKSLEQDGFTVALFSANPYL